MYLNQSFNALKMKSDHAERMKALEIYQVVKFKQISTQVEVMYKQVGEHAKIDRQIKIRELGFETSGKLLVVCSSEYSHSHTLRLLSKLYIFAEGFGFVGDLTGIKTMDRQIIFCAGCFGLALWGSKNF